MKSGVCHGSIDPTGLEHRRITEVAADRRYFGRVRILGKDSKHRDLEAGRGEGVTLGVLVGQIVRRVDIVER